MAEKNAIVAQAEVRHTELVDAVQEALLNISEFPEDFQGVTGRRRADYIVLVLQRKGLV